MAITTQPNLTEAIYKTILQAPVMVFAFDKEGIVTLSKGKGLSWIGVEPDQQLGMSIFDLYKGVPQLDLVRQALTKEEPARFEAQFRDSWYEVYLVPMHEDDGKFVGMSGIAFNITERHNMQFEAEESRHLYKSLFDLIPLGLGIADKQGNLLFHNGEIMRPGGYTREDIKAIGNVGKLYYDPLERNRVMAKAQQQGFVSEEEVKFKKKQGGFYYALMNLRPISYQGKDCWLALVGDITLRKQAEEELLRRNIELENLNRLLVGREVKMAELKRKLEQTGINGQ